MCHGLATAASRFKVRKVAMRKKVDKNWKPLGDQRGLQGGFEAAHVRARDKVRTRKAEAGLVFVPDTHEDKDTQYAGYVRQSWKKSKCYQTSRRG